MKILLLSFYFEPDLCAGSFRCSALVNELNKRSDVSVDLITTQPNRYASFKQASQSFEVDGNVRVYRVDLPEHQSGMADQIRSFSAYYRGAMNVVPESSYDLVVATSSRLFTAFLGRRMAERFNCPLYLDIRDIFVDTMGDVLPKPVAFFAKPILKLIEWYTFSKATRINLVSPGFKGYFAERFPTIEYRWFSNGIDEEFLQVGSADEVPPSSRTSVLYAGNIGEGQGLHSILPALAKKLNATHDFIVIGDGGRLEPLKAASLGISNIEFRPPTNRKELIEAYLSADILFLHLNDYQAFTKVLPSKIFEYAAVGKPIWAGVAGYAAEFLRVEVENAAVFAPGDVSGAVAALDDLTLVSVSRDNFCSKYARSEIMKQLVDDIIVAGESQ